MSEHKQKLQWEVLLEHVIFDTGLLCNCVIGRGDIVRKIQKNKNELSDIVKELLEALRAMVNMVDYAVEAGVNGSISNNCPTTEGARKAIPKALGE